MRIRVHASAYTHTRESELATLVRTSRGFFTSRRISSLGIFNIG